MGYRSSKKFVLTLQPVNGGGKAITFEVTPNKADKVLQLLAPEIDKKEKSMSMATVTLERFFVDAED